MAKIIAAAIQFYPRDSAYSQIVCGKRHCDCYEWMYNHRVDYDKLTQVQGFLTADNQFIDRYDAALIAFENDQLLKDSDTYQKMKNDWDTHGGFTRGYQLFSEDLW